MSEDEHRPPASCIAAEALGTAIIEAADAAPDPDDFWAVTELALRYLRAFGFDITPTVPPQEQRNKGGFS